MKSKLINICTSKEQADYSEQVMIAAHYEKISKEQIQDCTVALVTGNTAPFNITPLNDGYYDDSGGQLWIVTADVP